MNVRKRRSHCENLDSLSTEQLYALVFMEPRLTNEDLQSIRAIATERLEAGRVSAAQLIGGVSAAQLILELSGRLRETFSFREASRDFHSVMDRVVTDRVHIDLERDKRIVAVLSPVIRWVKISDLNAVFASLPSLGSDAESFADDVDRIRREIPRDPDPWA